MKKIISVFILSLGFVAGGYSSIEHCTDSSVGECYLYMSEIHPTQANVGMYQVITHNLPKYLLKATNAENAKELTSVIEKYQKKEPLPVVRGIHNKYYIVDGHHRLAGLYLFWRNNDYGVYPNLSQIKVYVDVSEINESSDEYHFWQLMEQNNYFWPYKYDASTNKYIKYSYKELPDTVVGLEDDPYRSVMGLAQKQGEFVKPEGEDSYFYQFKWGMCSLDYLGFIKPSDFDNMQNVIVSAINLLTDDADIMMNKCIGPEFKNMPKPIRK